MKTAFFLLAILGLSQAASISQHSLVDKSHRSEGSLYDDLQDFLELIPKDEIFQIVKSNVGDPQVDIVLHYLFSKEFAELVNEIEQIPEFIETVAYLENAGLPVSSWIQKLKNYFGITKVAKRNATSRDLNSIINEILAILPLDEIHALYEYKLVHSPAFAELIDKLNSPVFHTLIDTIVNLPEVQRIGQSLKEMGVDVHAIINLIKSFFGFNNSARSARSLLDDLKDFLELIPKDEIFQIVKSNVGDPQVDIVLHYLFSKEFAELVNEIEQIPEFIETVAYLENAGLPVSSWIQKLKNYFGITKVAKRNATSRDLNSIINEILAILPLDEIHALYEYKLVHSPAFAELIDKLNSPVFHTLIDTIVNLPEVQRIGQSLKEMGVDVHAIINLIKSFFGFNNSARSARSLLDDLKDFLELIPKDEIFQIVKSNVGDPQVDIVLHYLFSKEFAELVNEIEQIPEFIETVAYLENAGLPVSSWIQKLKNYFGITKVAKRNATSRDLNSIINEILAILPLDEIHALYEYKLVHSPAFAELIDKLNSPVFHTLIDTIVNLPEVQRIGQSLEEMGVDVHAIINLIKSFFGLHQ